MERPSTELRTIALALGAGTVALALTLIAAALGAGGAVVSAMASALACGVAVWGAARRSAAGVAAMAARLDAAAGGDLASPSPAATRAALPRLAGAADGLFAQVRADLDSINRLAMSDPVTGLPNRLHFRREADRILGGLAPGACAALLFVDLDRFKTVNDRFGHAEGDRVLMMVAERLRRIAAEEGLEDALVARLAGDEFTLLAPGLGEVAAERLGALLLTALDRPFDLAGAEVDLGGSIGIALFPEHGRTLSAMLRAADIAMYHAKAEGRGQLVLYGAALAARYEDRLRLDGELRRAIAGGELVLHFQPLVRARGRGVAGVEALVRWSHPAAGMRMPASFIAAAEDSGLIVELGEWVIDRAAATLGRWAAAGRRERMSVNVSPRQIERPDFFARLRETLARHGVPPQLFELEITEATAMQCSPAVLAGIVGLREAGVSIAIDDFGTGFSNLARLKDVPVDRVKLDPSLLHDIAGAAPSRTLVHSVVGLVHALGSEVVAEGVEDRGQLDVLAAIGCDLFQGYAVAEPMAEDEYLAWSAARSAARPRRVRAGAG